MQSWLSGLQGTDECWRGVEASKYADARRQSRASVTLISTASPRWPGWMIYDRRRLVRWTWTFTETRAPLLRLAAGLRSAADDALDARTAGVPSSDRAASGRSGCGEPAFWAAPAPRSSAPQILDGRYTGWGKRYTKYTVYPPRFQIHWIHNSK